MTRICSVPGCGTVVSPSTTSGVCRHHNHVVGYCDCSACRRRRLAKSPVQPGTAVVNVPVAATHSGVRASIPITLPKAPWDE